MQTDRVAFLQRVLLEPDSPRAGYPWDIPALADLRRGLRIPKGVTFFVGENGSGKSTLIEAIAMAWGFNAEGGTRSIRHSTYASESTLVDHLVLDRELQRPRGGFFLRAETMHGLFTELETMEDADLNPYGGESLHSRSHGESFLRVLQHRFSAPGLYLMDEPEAALSFRSTLALVSLLHEMAREGSQVLVATHSPVLAALPGATIFEMGERGIQTKAWGDLDLVQAWRRYLAEPQSYLRHLLADD